MKIPVYLLQSENFYGPMCEMFFKHNFWEDYDIYIKNFKGRVGENNMEAVKILDSTHIDQGDACVYDQFGTKFINGPIFKSKFAKKQGSNVEFYEFITILWLDFLYRKGHHDNTFDDPN